MGKVWGGGEERVRRERREDYERVKRGDKVKVLQGCNEVECICSLNFRLRKVAGRDVKEPASARLPTSEAYKSRSIVGIPHNHKRKQERKEKKRKEKKRKEKKRKEKKRKE